eukprot:5287172-Prymnesium_polylepis.1
MEVALLPQLLSPPKARSETEPKARKQQLEGQRVPFVTGFLRCTQVRCLSGHHRRCDAVCDTHPFCGPRSQPIPPLKPSTPAVTAVGAAVQEMCR